jgi:hypothetical protein
MNSPAALVGRHVLRSFGKHGIHKGTIASYDDDGELTFRVEYLDGDFEDLSQDDVEATLVPSRSSQVFGKQTMVRVTARSRRAKSREDSESDYIEDESHSDDHEVSTSSQATTQPFDDHEVPTSRHRKDNSAWGKRMEKELAAIERRAAGSESKAGDTRDDHSEVLPEAEVTHAVPTVLTENRQRSSRQRNTTGARLRSTSTLWIPCMCPTSISVHYNAVDRGLCAQALREHHTVLERAMGIIFPRFKWGKSHYLQVGYRILLRSNNILF